MSAAQRDGAMPAAGSGPVSVSVSVPERVPALLVSPHLDDAVFGCGRWLAANPGTRVVTVFAGLPREPDRSTEWDRRCGFASAGKAVAARRREDEAALRRLEARPCWLAFADSQYGETPGVEAVAAALVEAWRAAGAPPCLLLPIGIFHSDHRLVHDACIAAWRRLAEHADADAAPVPVALAYEDALYRSMPGLLQQRLAALAAAGLEMTPEPVTEALADLADPSCAARAAAHVAAKRDAVQAYRSQLRAFGPGGTPDVEQPERLWRLAR